MKSRMVESYCKIFERGDLTIGHIKQQYNADYNNIRHSIPLDTK